ncbi:hypothetical protein [Kaistia terrae]|uniref:DUF2336 domain-containing protein n=1 Tax=Kaistia terrae TaxID=537017 RepID=A0ABW0PUL1_9HYPH|nr:hypothetical protein [Kaistia terrae]MCX5576823.1 hypothetical protein [Kaistia terrae]
MAMAVSSQQSRDAALLRATTELFVLDKTHDQTGIRRFEELAAHFLTKVTSADRAFVAERLARHPDTPGAILRLLGKDLPEIASPILRHAPDLNSFDLLAIMAATGPAHYRMIASRHDLAPDIIGALRMTGDAETIALLPAVAEEAPLAPTIPPFEIETAEIPAVEIAEPILQLPTEFEAETPAIAPDVVQPVSEQTNHPPLKTASEPLSALAAARVLTASLSAEMSALASEIGQPGHLRPTLKPVAGPTAATPPPPVEAQAAVEIPAQTPHLAAKVAAGTPTEVTTEPAPAVPEMAFLEDTPVVADAQSSEADDVVAGDPAVAFLHLDRADRLALIAALSPGQISIPKPSSMQVDHAFRAALSRARLPMLARQRQREALIAALSEGLRLDIDQVTTLLDDPSGEALVVLLKAIGLSDTEAQQVLLFANPVMRDAVEAFFRLTELLSGVAQPAANQLVGYWRGDAEAEPVHQPHFADVPRKDSRPVATERQGVNERVKWAEKIA